MDEAQFTALLFKFPQVGMATIGGTWSTVRLLEIAVTHQRSHQ
jgi:hypothetical protein